MLLKIAYPLINKKRTIDGSHFLCCQQDVDGLIRSKQVFGVPAGSTGSQYGGMMGRDPPQYMLDLYNSVADQNGITRSTNPYNATTIRSFANKGR